LQPKKYKDYDKYKIIKKMYKRKKKPSIVPKFGYDGPEKKVTFMGISIPFSSNQREDLFYVKVQAKMVKFDALFDFSSQSNLITKFLIARLGLPLISHPYPYG